MRSVFAATSASEASAHRPERAGKGAGRAASRLATHLGRHLFLRGLDVSKLAGRAVSLGVELLPFAGCGRARRGRGERGWALVSRARRTGNRVHPRAGKRARGATRRRRARGDRASRFSVCALSQPRAPFSSSLACSASASGSMTPDGFFTRRAGQRLFCRLPHRGADRAVRRAMLDPPPPPCRGPSFDPLSRTRRREVEVRTGCVRVVRRAVESARRAI